MSDFLQNITSEELFILQLVGEAANELQYPTYAIGGFVRDLILNRSRKDIDIVCQGSGIDLAHLVAQKLPKKTKVSFFKNFGTAMFKYGGIEVEFVGARKESYRRDSRKPIVEDGTLEDDQDRRDFTINAMAINLDKNNFGQLVDPFNGLEDLKNGIIKTPLAPDITFDDDPLRMLRAIRFATQLQFKIEQETYFSIKRMSTRIAIVSIERIADELNKIILSEVPSTGFKHLFNTQLLPIIFPEMQNLHGVSMVENYGHKDNFYHTIKVLDNVADRSPDLWLRWAAILHDIAKPLTQRFEEGHGWTFHGHDAVGAKMVPRIFAHFKLPLNEKMKFVQKLVALHLRPISLTKENITDSAIRRLIVDANEDLEALLTLCEADITSKNPDKVRKYTKNLHLVKQKIEEVEERDHLKNWQPPIDGESIMKIFNIRPGKEVGILKNAIKEAILEGAIKNEYTDAFDFMVKKGIEIGLIPLAEHERK
ncbi:MAG: HD domain-containing protein [Chitinophagales bacterium]|nr:HD domain-containing protein [Chitinophagales bacterium]